MHVRCKSVSGTLENQYVVKGLHGRGKKRHDWVEHLHQILLSEFERLSSSDLQFIRGLIQNVAMTLLHEENSVCSSLDVNPTSGGQITEHLTFKWIYSVLNRFNIVKRRQSEALSWSPARTAFIERKYRTIQDV